MKKLESIFPDTSGTTRIQLCSSEHANPLRVSNRHHLRVAKNLADALLFLQEGEHLLLHGLHLFTRVDVALLVIAAAAFQDVGFVRPRGHESAVWLSHFNGCGGGGETPRMLAETIQALKDVVDNNNGGGERLLEVLPVDQLVRNDRFYAAVVDFNIMCLKEKAMALLSGAH